MYSGFFLFYFEEELLTFSKYFCLYIKKVKISTLEFFKHPQHIGYKIN